VADICCSGFEVLDDLLVISLLAGSKTRPPIPSKQRGTLNISEFNRTVIPIELFRHSMECGARLPVLKARRG
jgi:hypothetical protein